MKTVNGFFNISIPIKSETRNSNNFVVRFRYKDKLNVFLFLIIVYKNG